MVKIPLELLPHLPRTDDLKELKSGDHPHASLYQLNGGSEKHNR